MPLLDDILDKPPETPPLHPRLRHWAERIRNGAEARLEVFRPATALGLTQSEMNVRFTEKDAPPSLESVPWDDELNAGLVQLRIRASDLANETDRFALGLCAALRKAERDFGDGYFNAVLRELVTESGLSGDPEIAEVLKHAYALQPNRQGKNYNLCREMVAAAISGRIYELKHQLDYDANEARKILVSALARYLDERFSVSNRRRLGLL